MKYVAWIATLAACSGKTDADAEDSAGGGLTLEEFGDQFYDVFCVEWEACNTSTACPASTTTSATDDCDFDPVAAQACLDGVWSCDATYPGFEYPVPPATCSDACGGAPTTPQ